jgi:hypothetical protein
VYGLVGNSYVQRRAISVGVDGYRRDFHFATGSRYAHRDLTAIGYQDLFEHRGDERLNEKGKSENITFAFSQLRFLSCLVSGVVELRFAS